MVPFEMTHADNFANAYAHHMPDVDIFSCTARPVHKPNPFPWYTFFLLMDGAVVCSGPSPGPKSNFPLQIDENERAM